MRIAIGGIFHETNTFSNVKTDTDFFKLYEWEYDEEILTNHTGVGDYLGGIIARGIEEGVTFIPTFSARANPAGLITKQTYDEMKNELLSRIEKAGKLDGICLALHGAGVVEGIDDLEGNLLFEIRQCVGYTIPITASLDLHSNLTDTMVKEANALFGVNHYPHTDCFERGSEALENLVKIIKGKIEPVMALEKLPLMIPTSTTYHSPAKDINEYCWQWEKEDSIIDCTFFHGFCHTDIPEMNVSVLTIAHRDLELARKVSKDVADKVWSKKNEFFLDLPNPKEGIDQALTIEGNPIIINETSDNPGGGSPGDGTHLLKAMIEMNIPETCFGFIYDPEVVEIAHQTGIGSHVDIKLGGKTHPLHGEPLPLKAYIKCLTDGRFVQTSAMSKGKKVNLGKSVRLQVGNVDIIVCSVRQQTFDEQVFQLHGIDVTKYKIVALKSSNHFRAAFKPLAHKIITVDSPGLSSFNLKNFNYERVKRPIVPLDSNVTKY
jgi:microcystin degradation protein MlrC